MDVADLHGRILTGCETCGLMNRHRGERTLSRCYRWAITFQVSPLDRVSGLIAGACLPAPDAVSDRATVTIDLRPASGIADHETDVISRSVEPAGRLPRVASSSAGAAGYTASRAARSPRAIADTYA